MARQLPATFAMAAQTDQQIASRIQAFISTLHEARAEWGIFHMLIAQAVNSSMNVFMARGLNIEATDSGWSDKLGGWMLQILGGVMGGSMFGSFAFGSFSALHTRHKMMTKWKTAYVRAVLRQDIGWYDMHQGQKLAGQMGEAMIHIDRAFGVPTYQGCMPVSVCSNVIALSLPRISQSAHSQFSPCSLPTDISLG